MQLSKTIKDINLEASVVTIGMFDGVHIGHQQIINRLKIKSFQIDTPSCLITFHPHPAFILRKLDKPFYLTTPQERAEILFDLGVDHVIVLPFSHELSLYTPDQFIRMLNKQLNIKHLCVGSDFALGKHRTGNHHTLKVIGRQLGYTLETVAPVQTNGKKVSSSLIRQVLQHGQVEFAADLLGRPYSISERIMAPRDIHYSVGGVAHFQILYESLKITPQEGLYAADLNVDNEQSLSIVEVISSEEPGDGIIHRKIEIYTSYDLKKIKNQTFTVRFLRHMCDASRFETVQEKIAMITSQLESDKGNFR